MSASPGEERPGGGRVPGVGAGRLTGNGGLGGEEQRVDGGYVDSILP
jgi:hypothetical protein